MKKRFYLIYQQAMQSRKNKYEALMCWHHSTCQVLQDAFSGKQERSALSKPYRKESIEIKSTKLNKKETLFSFKLNFIH